MKHATFIIAALCALITTAEAWPAGGFAKSPSKNNPSAVQKYAAQELSTEMSGLDSLDVMPEEVITTHDGGYRKVTLESAVFHRETPFVYEGRNRRDPFRPLLVDAKSEAKDDPDPDLLRMDGAKLQGVVWAEGHYLALVRDKSGKIFFLREGDKIYQGHVLMVTQAQAMFEIADFGDYDQITLKVKG